MRVAPVCSDNQGRQRMKRRASKEVPQNKGEIPRSILLVSLVVLAAASTLNLPTVAAWVPSARTFVGQHHHITTAKSPSNTFTAKVLGSATAHKARLRFPVCLQAKKPVVDDDDEGDEEGEWDEEEVDVEVEYVDEEEYEEEEYEEDEEEYEYVDDDTDDNEEEEEEEADNEDETTVDEADILVAQTLKNNKEDVREAEEEAEEEEEAWEKEDEAWEKEEEQWQNEEAASSDEEEEGEYPLEDDLDDPNYQKQKELLETAVAESDRVGRDRNFDAMNFMMNEMTVDQMKAMDQLPFIKEVQERAKSVTLSEADFDGVDLEEELQQTSDLMDDDPYPRHDEGEENFLEENVGITDDDMEKVDDVWKRLRKRVTEPSWDKVTEKAEEFDGLEGLSNETIEELGECLDAVGGSSYNVTKYLLYDLDFNVTNLMLAAVKHNREAPILFMHWYPQLATYSRYAYAQERNFDFTWEDVENADMSELERYYHGMGYDEIPEKAPAETGIIEFDYLDEEEIKMAAFEEWIKDVYNFEWDKKDLDDDNFEDEDNVFSPHFEVTDHPDVPSFETVQEDIEYWQQDVGTDEELKGDEATKAYRDYLAKNVKYTYDDDKEFEEEFRGHLVVACTRDDKDLEVAEKITLAMEKAFGKQVYVETQVIAHAREEDNVFEVWLESYEIELLHSKKRATSNAKDWDGPADVDDKQVEYLVDKVGFLISDESRYSYSMEFDGVV